MPSQLRVWSFDKTLTKNDKEDLVKHFGAVAVRHVVRQGREAALLASFKNDADCEYALQKLHQLQVLGVRLMAAYSDCSSYVSSEQPHRKQKLDTSDDPNQDEKNRKKIEQVEARLSAIGAKFGLNHPIPPTLRYFYPPPSPTIIANIAQTLVTVPKFYTQVLHLMNKMNLPTPFGSLFDISSIYEDVLRLRGYHEKNERTDILNENSEATSQIKMGFNDNKERGRSPQYETSESESELESDGDTTIKRVKKPCQPVKRSIRPKNVINKRPKLSQLQQTVMPHPRASEPSSVKEVFEAADTPEPKRLQMNLQGATLPQEVAGTESGGITLQPGGFGKMEAPVEDKTQEEGQDMVEWREKSKFISKEELMDNMVNKSDWPILPVFKNYSPGEPSTKLYIKNLAKTTSEDNLKHIYGRYIFWQNDEEANMFTIRVMKEGRMKGQAFVTFPTEKQAAEALEDTNGYILNDKPMVVVYGKVKRT